MSIERIFAQGGCLSRQMPDYRPRAGQIAMARAVEDSLGGGCHVLEAGPGIGKTFAYLAPIIENGLTAVISTGTRALQDQLYLHDIPFLSNAMRKPVQFAVLKGRQNYICRRNLEEAPAREFFSEDDGGRWKILLEFAASSGEGDIRDAAGIAANDPVWEAVTSTRESCPVQACAHYARCFLYQARARARAANIVIVNHHLFLSDMRLKEEGIAEIVPARDIVLFDEAHLLPQLAPQYFGESVSVAQLIRLAKDAERAVAGEVDASGLVAAARTLPRAADALLAVADGFEMQSIAHADFCGKCKTVADEITGVLNELAAGLMRKAENGERIAAAAGKAAESLDKWTRWFSPSPPEDNGETPMISWAEKRAGLTLTTAPLSGRDIFKRQWAQAKCAVFTSATLSVAGGFDDFCRETGLDDAETHSWESPYDFANRALLYLPRRMPDPNGGEHPQATARAALPLIRANRGRAFMLFTSWRALRQGGDFLRRHLGKEFQIFQQGEMPNDECLRRFRRAKAGVLVGSQSFWQGVDVKGEALSLVVVDKIPFTAPGDPLLAARDAWRKSRGENAFMLNQLPPAAVLMKQAAGRLMRDFSDRGVLVLCDPRLRIRNYGRMILDSLPPMKRCQDEKEAMAFLQRK